MHGYANFYLCVPSFLSLRAIIHLLMCCHTFYKLWFCTAWVLAQDASIATSNMQQSAFIIVIVCSCLELNK